MLTNLILFIANTLVMIHKENMVLLQYMAPEQDARTLSAQFENELANIKQTFNPDPPQDQGEQKPEEKK